MPEKVNDKTVFSLLEVTRSIQKTLSNRYKSAFWVKAEMNELNHYPQSGHCYPSLVEKKDGKVIAKIMANIWKDDFVRINRNFQKVLKEPLKDGIKILFSAKITFHPEYGLKLRIIDIDPSYTLGDLEIEKQETIECLKKEGIFDKNKILKLPLIPQRIAIISVKTAKGYGDLLEVIDGNPWGYKFFHFLFPAFLQGEKAVKSISNQLRKIKKVRSHFDAIAIIRGGSDDIGLSCYNNYHLSKEVALCPIPVITGIGHKGIKTVVEMVAFHDEIVPAKLGEYLLQKFHNFSVPVQKAEETLIDKSIKILKDEKLKLHNSVKYFRSVTSNMLATSNNKIKNQFSILLQQSNFLFRRERESYVAIMTGIKKGTLFFCNKTKQVIKQYALNMKKDVLSNLSHSRLVVLQSLQQIERNSKDLILSNVQKMQQSIEKLFEKSALLLKNENNEVNSIERSVNNMNPKNVLKRGYSITLLNAKAIRSYKQVKQGDTIDTIVIDGNILSNVETTNKSEEL